MSSQFFGMDISAENLTAHMASLKLQYEQKRKTRGQSDLSASESESKSERGEDLYLYPPLDVSSLDTAYEYAHMFKQQHPGYDALVLKSSGVEAVRNYVGEVYTGFPPVGGMLSEALRSVNQRCFATRMVHATFHIGSRNGDWSDETAEEYIRVNRLLAKEARGDAHPGCLYASRAALVGLKCLK
eukprot:CAMPEP_0182439040 /NCGR_PEP_ID=MMETSP1167-20130531/86179_1 /TAXON_ID=2988 /ORGANISM="Mallomonas Sp, Strain CCMP3275" /LENGTH=184 /DNA_ID=CAMNT_0024632625 /DNA_START=917 /DNA_END=1471 /DNA_ORIENTATION=+